jgi:DNA-binding GntR family transcriptional regulator
VRDLCSRSSLIISLYWRRRDTICESHAHTALVDAIAKRQPKDAAELMTSHLSTSYRVSTSQSVLAPEFRRSDRF